MIFIIFRACNNWNYSIATLRLGQFSNCSIWDIVTVNANKWGSSKFSNFTLKEKYARNIRETKTNLIKLPKESDWKSNVINKLE